MSAPQANARPGAPDAILDRIETLRRHRNHYVLVNTLLRQKNDAGLAALGYDADQIARLKEPDTRGRTGFVAQADATKQTIKRLRRRLKREATNGN